MVVDNVDDALQATWCGPTHTTVIFAGQIDDSSGHLPELRYGHDDDSFLGCAFTGISFELI